MVASSISSQRITSSAHSSHPGLHLVPHPGSPPFSYTSSISPIPGSRPSSPALVSPGTTAPIQTPPQSPSAFHLKSLSASVPSTPPPTVIAVGSPTPGVGPSCYSYRPPVPPTISIFSLYAQPTTRTVLFLSGILSAIATGGNFPEHCTAPTHVLYSKEIFSLLASPFVVPATPTLLAGAGNSLNTSLVLGTFNILSLALFEEHLSGAFGSTSGSRIFRNLFLSIVVFVMILRQLSGFVFSRAVGWQMPVLFFSDSMFECNLGLAPYLFGLLMVQFLFKESTEKTSLPWGIHRTYIQIFLCLVNIIPKTIIWWAGCGMVSGLVAGSILNRQRKKGHWGGKVKSSVNEKERWESGIYGSLIDDDEDEFSDSALSSNESVDYNSDSYSSVPLFKSGRRSRISGRKAVFQALPKFVFVIAVLLGCNWYHTLRTDVSNEDLNQSIDPQSSYLLTLILMTAPRRTGAVYIKETLSSYLENFPDEDADELYSRIQIVIYTHFTDFTGYDEAKAYFDTIPKARKYVRWVREEGSEISQRKHLVSAIRKIGTEMDSAYLGIMEDDFPFCKHGWQDMLNTVYEANQRVKEHCGVFVGTGGSGLIFKRAVALTASFILENDVLMAAQGLEVPPPDITLQDCMLGLHDYCSTCAGTMVISRTLAQKHLGYNSSTSGDGYDKNQFQCGWRHPFNGLPNVHSF